MQYQPEQNRLINSARHYFNANEYSGLLLVAWYNVGLRSVRRMGNEHAVINETLYHSVTWLLYLSGVGYYNTTNLLPRTL